MPTSAIGGSSSSSQQGGTNKALSGLNLDEFLKVMITELQNQDPLNPMDNAQILQQISQMREIQASDDMRKTLESVLLGQTLSSASSMIDRHISALSETGNEVDGRVERVTIEAGKPLLHVGTEKVRLTNIRSILPQE